MLKCLNMFSLRKVTFNISNWLMASREALWVLTGGQTVRPDLSWVYPTRWIGKELQLVHTPFQWPLYCYGISIYQQLDCLFNLFFRLTLKKPPKLCITFPLWGYITVDLTHNGTVIKKLVLYQTVSMPYRCHCTVNNKLKSPKHGCHSGGCLSFQMQFNFCILFS